MKTAFNAVNELKGEIPCVLTRGQEWLFYSNNGVLNVGLEHNGVGVCTFDQFNDLVSQMETNFGECEESYRGYKIQFEYMTNKSDKELEVMDIDWSKAPEGATHYDGFLYYKECLGYFEFFCTDSWEWKRSGSSKSLLLHHMVSTKTSQQPKPVFTQEMCDNGELPSVGMECMLSNGVTYDKSTILFTSDKHVIYLTGKKEWCKYRSDIDVKPLTPPIELIDGKAYQFVNEGATIEQGIYYEGMLINQHGNTALMLCTNIQPLTVGK